MKKITVNLFLLLSATFLFAKASYAFDFPGGMDAYIGSGQINSAPHSVDTIINQLSTLLAGTSGIGGSNNPTTLNEQFHGSVLGQLHKGVALALNTNPVELQPYFAYMESKIGIAQPAYAQGVGFLGLSPLLNVWTIFRNVAYGFLTIIMVVIGFMILFRMKIDPRTTVSIQNAIPRIIVTLLLVTFSYPIVGLLIEVMYLFIFLAVNALAAPYAGILNQFNSFAITNTIGTFFTKGVATIPSLATFLGFKDLGFTELLNDLAQGNTLHALTTAISLQLTGPTDPTNWATLIGYLLIGLVVVIALIIMMLRIFVMLLGAWVQIIFAAIFGPLILMFGAVPGLNTFSFWLRNLVANLIVFPITIIALTIATILTANGVASKIWTAPGLGGTNPLGVAGLISFAILMATPSLVNSVKKVLQAQSLVSAGPGTLLSPISQGVSSIWGLAYQARIIGLQSPIRRDPTTNKLGLRLPFGGPKAPPHSG